MEGEEVVVEVVVEGEEVVVEVVVPCVVVGELVPSLPTLVLNTCSKTLANFSSFLSSFHSVDPL